MAIAKVTGCVDNDCEDKIPSGVGVTAHTCYKTKVCNETKKQIGVSGNIWTVQYYNQQLEEDEALWNLDGYTSPVYQNYLKIDKFPIILDGSITPAIDGDTSLVNATGSGKAPYLLRLHPGDVIVGPVGSNTYYFSVTSVVPTSIADTTWSNIEFTLIGPAGPGIPMYDNLEAKVVDTLTFDKDYGLLSSSAVDERKDLTPLLSSLLKNYLSKFLKNGKLMMKYKGKKVYDPAMNQFVSSMIGAIGPCGAPAVSSPDFDKQAGGPNLLESLIDRSLSLTSAICPQRCMHLISTATIHNNDYIRAITTADYIVGNDYVFMQNHTTPTVSDCPPHDDPELQPVTPPTVPPESTCIQLDNCCFCSGEDPLNDVNSNYGRTIEVDTEIIPIIKNPLGDDYYILSKAFYEGTLAEMSYLERMVYRYTHNESISIADVLPLLRDIIHWCMISWFYYAPLLMLLTKYAMSNKGNCSIP